MMEEKKLYINITVYYNIYNMYSYLIVINLCSTAKEECSTSLNKEMKHSFKTHHRWAKLREFSLFAFYVQTN